MNRILDAAFPPMAVARALLAEAYGTGEAAPGWRWGRLAGRVVEIAETVGTAELSAAAGVILEAQERGMLAAWIGDLRSSFYPPDFAAAGIDLGALPVVHVHEAARAWRAADALLRSGSFAVVVLDLDAGGELPFPVQTRLGALAKKHNAVLLHLRREALRRPARGSLASLRVETEKRRSGREGFTAEIRAVKDKMDAPGWRYKEVRHGPDGLC